MNPPALLIERVGRQIRCMHHWHSALGGSALAEQLNVQNLHVFSIGLMLK